jgi:hypothetical protein
MLPVMLLIFVSHHNACFICEMWFALMTNLQGRSVQLA